jgi:hypothetical protein
MREDVLTCKDDVSMLFSIKTHKNIKYLKVQNNYDS